jgi:hypothetical protein
VHDHNWPGILLFAPDGDLEYAHGITKGTLNAFTVS